MPCLICGRSMFLNTPYCEEHWLHKNNKVQVFPGMKERFIRDFLYDFVQTNFNVYVEWNRQLPLTNIRPDFHFFNYSSRLVVIEVDEYMHRGYNKQDEDVRCNKIKALYPECIIVRLNVDAYTSGVQKYPPIWSKSKTVNELTMNVETRITIDEVELERRIEILKDIIIECFHPNTRSAEYTLFYS